MLLYLRYLTKYVYEIGINVKFRSALSCICDGNFGIFFTQKFYLLNIIHSSPKIEGFCHVLAPCKISSRFFFIIFTCKMTAKSEKNQFLVHFLSFYSLRSSPTTISFYSDTNSNSMYKIMTDAWTDTQT